MSAYVVVQLNPTNMEKMEEYRAVAMEPIKKHGGRPLAGGGNIEILESYVDSTVIVTLEFPSADDARNWFNDPEYAHVHKLRNEAGKTSVAILPAI